MNLTNGILLQQDFFSRKTDIVAKELLGKYLVYHHAQGDVIAKIVETEAYMGEEDAACHSAVGRTKRNSVMFGEAGRCYLYRIYGVHTCYNITTDEKNIAAAVLIRGMVPVAGVSLLSVNRPGVVAEKLLQGPGNICKAMGWDLAFNGLSVYENDSRIQLYAAGNGLDDGEIVQTTRVGISKEKEALLRFYLKGSPGVSKK